MLRSTFPAMGTEVEVLLDGEPSAESERALAKVEREFERLEALLSRFRPDSELSALNRRGALLAGDDLLAVTGLAVDARRRTGGLFDPTVHDALVGAGYDRTFAEVRRDGPRLEPHRCGGEIRLDGRRIELEPGFRLDLGGIAKGYAADRAATLLAPLGPALVNAGGDIVARGRLWPVGVETAVGRQLTLGLENSALATSGRDRRRWRRGGIEAHHLIDPATGAPAAGEFLRVTVTAPTAVEAEVLAKAVFLGAAPTGPAVLVRADGRTVLAGGLE
jgi:thiamine biosynthesis lipoprotein